MKRWSCFPTDSLATPTWRCAAESPSHVAAERKTMETRQRGMQIVGHLYDQLTQERPMKHAKGPRNLWKHSKQALELPRLPAGGRAAGTLRAPTKPCLHSGDVSPLCDPSNNDFQLRQRLLRGPPRFHNSRFSSGSALLPNGTQPPVSAWQQQQQRPSGRGSQTAGGKASDG